MFALITKVHLNLMMTILLFSC